MRKPRNTMKAKDLPVTTFGSMADTVISFNTNKNPCHALPHPGFLSFPFLFFPFRPHNLVDSQSVDAAVKTLADKEIYLRTISHIGKKAI